MSGENEGAYVLAQTRTIRKARKPHQCCACRTTIPIGAYYSYTWTATDDGLYTDKRCGRCERTYEHLSALCEAMRRKGLANLVPMTDLSCGLRYEDEWGAVPEEIARLPFLTDAEASELLESERRAGR